MKSLLSLILILGLNSSVFAATTKVRTIKNLPDFPRESLRVRVSYKFFKSLLISPVEAYIVARAPVSNIETEDGTIIRSEAGGIYDSIALNFAKGVRVTGFDRTFSRITRTHNDVHLLIYKLADGLMAVAFYHSDDPQHADYRQYGTVFIGTQKNGKWTWLEGGNKRR